MAILGVKFSRVGKQLAVVAAATVILVGNPAAAAKSLGFSCNPASGSCKCTGGIDSVDCKWMKDACKGEPTFCTPTKSKTCGCDTKVLFRKVGAGVN